VLSTPFSALHYYFTHYKQFLLKWHQNAFLKSKVVSLKKKMSSAATLKQYPTIGTILDPPRFLLVNTFKPNIGHS
jgi:hypothetical protein